MRKKHVGGCQGMEGKTRSIFRYISEVSMPHPTLDCTPVSKLEQYVQREEPHILFSVFLLFFVPSTFFDLYEINRSCPTTVF